MIGYTYSYTSFEEIISQVGSISELSFMMIIFCIISVLGTILLIYCILPLVIIWTQTLSEQKEKRNKKKLLQQILLQKEIEDEVEKEIKIQGENELSP